MKATLAFLTVLTVSAQVPAAPPAPPTSPTPRPAPAELPEPAQLPGLPELAVDLNIEPLVNIDPDLLADVQARLADLAGARVGMELAADLLGAVPLPPLPPMAPPEPGELFAQAQQAPVLAPRPPVPPHAPLQRDRVPRFARDEDRSYSRGTSYLDRRQWEKAAEAFQAVIDGKGQRADGAYYWKAYALYKLGRTSEAEAAIAELQKSFPNSRWLNDAKALQVEIRQAGGRAVSPESESDEELKLLAINGLISTEPERAMPLLDKILKGGSSPRLKSRALFVLAQSRDPKGREIVAQVARGAGNPDLQLKAIEYLGIHDGRDNAMLAEIYSSTQDAAVKRAILRSFMHSRDKDRLLGIARADANEDLRKEAIQWLGATKAQAELAQMYNSEASPELRRRILQSLFAAGAHDKVVEIAKSEKDPKVRADAVQYLGIIKREDASATLVSLYAGESDKNVRRRIAHSLFARKNAPALIELARQESDPEVKREIVRMLTSMKSKEATDFLIDLLNK
ncbi:MAG: HEAT repeat domain-containing protein [Acidobacteria bacterium]|nr:HEAT repeat domain-containing protein [Acidobacteriota bacterium]